MQGKALQFLIRIPAALLVAILALPVAIAAELRVVDHSGNPMQYAVVTASVETSGPLHSAKGAVIYQRRQQFQPRVTVVRRGSWVQFPNRDTTLHHVYSFSKAKTFEIELYEGDSPDPIEFDQPGIVALGCNIHDWMLGYIYVSDDDLFAVSGGDGSLHLEAPLGDLTELQVWHPAAVQVAPQSVRVGDLDLSGEPVTITVETRADNPLHFEIDPLQALFNETQP